MNSACIGMAVLLVTAATPTERQTEVAGTWRVDRDGSPLWEVVLRVDGPRLTGAVTSCARAGSGIPIVDGRVNGTTVAFKCLRGDGVSTLEFTGKIDGDEIAFAWQARGPGDAPGAANRMFGPSAPSRFTAKRVPDSELAKMVDAVWGLEIAAAVNLVQKDVKVEGRLFVPQKVARLAAVMVVTNWGLGQRFYEDPQTRRLAETTGLGLLLVRVTNVGPSAYDSRRNLAADGADALLQLLQRLGEEFGRPEVKDAALLFWGHSAAGSDGPAFAGRYPQRTVGLVGYQTNAMGNALGGAKILNKIPALVFAGGSDAAVPAEGVKESWRIGRSAAAPWTLAIQPDAQHGSGEYLRKANDLLIPWVTAVLRQRHSPDATTLRVIDDASAWMADNRTREVAPYATFRGEKVEASWLPDEATARGWQVVTAPVKRE